MRAFLTCTLDLRLNLIQFKFNLQHSRDTLLPQLLFYQKTRLKKFFMTVDFTNITDEKRQQTEL